MVKTSKMIKVLTILILAVMLTGTISALIPNEVYADYKDIISKTDGQVSTSNMGDIQKKASNVVGMIRTIAVIAGVIILTVLGVQYMLGSVEQKAEYKKTLVPLVIGIIVVMGSSQIAAMLFSFAE